MNADELRRITASSKTAAERKAQEDASKKLKEYGEKELIPDVIKKFEAVLAAAAAKGSNRASFPLPKYYGHRNSYPRDGVATREALEQYCNDNKLQYDHRSVAMYPGDEGPDTSFKPCVGAAVSYYEHYLDVSW